MTEAEMRGHRCCFTGHRPEKLLRSKEQITADLTTAIDKAIEYVGRILHPAAEAFYS